jgi:hypothetical protein
MMMMNNSWIIHHATRPPPTPPRVPRRTEQQLPHKRLSQALAAARDHHREWLGGRDEAPHRAVPVEQRKHRANARARSRRHPQRRREICTEKGLAADVSFSQRGLSDASMQALARHFAALAHQSGWRTHAAARRGTGQYQQACASPPTLAGGLCMHAGGGCNFKCPDPCEHVNNSNRNNATNTHPGE